MRELLAAIHYSSWVLPTLLLLPLLGAAVIGLTKPSEDVGVGHEIDDAHGKQVRAICLATLVIEAVVSAGMWWAFDPASTGWQFTVDMPWIPDWGARFTLGVDGISLFMVLLTTFLMPLALSGDWTSVRTKLRTHYALMLVLTTGMIGVFLALDLLVFYVFWEIMLVPMYFIIGMWGGERRAYASVKFFLYTMLGSLLMLVAILYIWRSTGATSFDYDHLLRTLDVSNKASLWLFGAFFLAFAIKVPLFPFHTWLPDAHVEAPTSGSVILAGVMLKMGTYGFLRFALPLFPAAAMQPTVRAIILGLAVVSVIYGALVAMVQPDLKKLVAYSSVSHLGFVMLGIFALTVQSVQGALMVMVSHGISTGALFLLIGMLYERAHTREIARFGGIARVAPMFATAFTIASLSSIGLPGTNGFVGEFLVLTGSFRSVPIFAVIAAIGVILAAAYLLWGLQRVIFNPLTEGHNATLTDLNRRELAVVGLIVVAIVWIGIQPGPMLSRMHGAAQRLVENVQHGAQVAASRAPDGSPPDAAPPDLPPNAVTPR
jgi:NADH-quinone oxidoreductase subunit M